MNAETQRGRIAAEQGTRRIFSFLLCDILCCSASLRSSVPSLCALWLNLVLLGILQHLHFG